MPSSEGKPTVSGDIAGIITHFEKVLNRLLESHTYYQKKVAQLTEENQVLKNLLQSTPNAPAQMGRTKNFKQLLPSNEWEQLMKQINLYIKEIDFCLAYFEQA